MGHWEMMRLKNTVISIVMLIVVLTVVTGLMLVANNWANKRGQERCENTGGTYAASALVAHSLCITDKGARK